MEEVQAMEVVRLNKAMKYRLFYLYRIMNFLYVYNIYKEEIKYYLKYLCDELVKDDALL